MEEFSLLKPTTNFIFKRIFGNEEGKIALISLLNAILNGNPVVKDLTFLNTEPPKDDFESKASRLDVEVTTDNGTIVNIEIQCVDTGDLDDRSITYASKLVGQYTTRGKSYKEPKVISIWIIRDKIRHGPMASRECPIEEVSYHLKLNLFGEESKELSNKIRIIFIHLSKFKEGKLLYKIDKIMKDWAKFFDNPSKVENKDGGMKEAQYIWMKVAGDDNVKAKIRAIEKYEMDKGSEIAEAKEEGIKQGKKEGLIEGKKEGLIEGQKQIALNMKNQGFEDEVIAKCLNINIDKLSKLFS